MGKNLCDEIDQVVDLDGDHIRIAALSLRRESQRCRRRTLRTPAPIFTIGLAGTLIEKCRACLPPQSHLTNDCNHLPARYASGW
jgi:hypothetical protein